MDLGALGGSLVSSAANIFMQERANEANKAAASKQQRFQNMMSSTAHQREVKDLRDAGLNPVLSAGSGGASSPSGAMSTAGAARIDDLGETVRASKIASLERDNLKADSKLKKASSASAVAAAENSRASAAAQRQSALESKARTLNQLQQNDLLRQEAESRENELKVIRDNPWIPKARSFMDLIGHGLGNVTDALNIGKLFVPKGQRRTQTRETIKDGVKYRDTTDYID